MSISEQHESREHGTPDGEGYHIIIRLLVSQPHKPDVWPGLAEDSTPPASAAMQVTLPASFLPQSKPRPNLEADREARAASYYTARQKLKSGSAANKDTRASRKDTGLKTRPSCIDGAVPSGHWQVHAAISCRAQILHIGRRSNSATQSTAFKLLNSGWICTKRHKNT